MVETTESGSQNSSGVAAGQQGKPVGAVCPREQAKAVFCCKFRSYLGLMDARWGLI
jgi:hypothetical protein